MTMTSTETGQLDAAVCLFRSLGDPARLRIIAELSKVSAVWWT